MKVLPTGLRWRVRFWCWWLGLLWLRCFWTHGRHGCPMLALNLLSDGSSVDSPSVTAVAVATSLVCFKFTRYWSAAFLSWHTEMTVAGTSSCSYSCSTWQWRFLRELVSRSRPYRKQQLGQVLRPICEFDHSVHRSTWWPRGNEIDAPDSSLVGCKASFIQWAREDSANRYFPISHAVRRRARTMGCALRFGNESADLIG